MASQQQLDLLASGKTRWDRWRRDYAEVQALEPDLHGADLHRADLTEANLQEADLDGANLCKATFNGANMSGVVGVCRQEVSKQRMSEQESPNLLAG